MSLRRHVLCAAACVVLCARTAQAGDGDAQERSAALFREGVTAGKAGDYAHAEIAFRTSYLLAPSPSTLRNWALTEMHLGKMVEALGHLKVAVRSAGWTAEQRALVQQNLDDAYAATGHLAVQTTKGASVAIDGVLAPGVAPFDGTVDVPPGHRQIDARLGSAIAHAEVDALPGAIVEVRIPLAEVATAPAATVAQLPAIAQEPSPSETADRDPSRSATWWTPPHRATVLLGATALVGAALGLSLEVTSNAAASDANALRVGLTGACSGPSVAPGCAALRAKIDTVHEEDAIKDVGFAVAGAAGVAAVIVWAVAGRSRAIRTGAVRWTPIATPAGAGIEGSF
jgi:hypothetical protein